MVNFKLPLLYDKGLRALCMCYQRVLCRMVVSCPTDVEDCNVLVCLYLKRHPMSKSKFRPNQWRR